jgi:hypothetical protein
MKTGSNSKLKERVAIFCSLKHVGVYFLVKFSEKLSMNSLVYNSNYRRDIFISGCLSFLSVTTDIIYCIGLQLSLKYFI